MPTTKTLFAERDLRIELIQDPDDPVWQTIYEKYCNSFLIDDERESLDSLKKDVFDSVADPTDDSKDSLLVMMKNNEVVAVYIINWSKISEKMSAGIGMYLFTDPAYRGKGLATLLVNCGEVFLKNQAKEAGTELAGVFVEVNNPTKMDNETLALDNKTMDPYQRIIFWKKRGFLKIDFCYEQPALKPQGKTAPYLDLYFKPLQPEFSNGLPKELLLEAMKKYFFDKSNKAHENSYLDKMNKNLFGKRLVGLTTN